MCANRVSLAGIEPNQHPSSGLQSHISLVAPTVNGKLFWLTSNEAGLYAFNRIVICPPHAAKYNPWKDARGRSSIPHATS